MIKIIKVGKVNKKEIDSLSNFYLKQIPRKVEVITVKDESDISKIGIEGLAILKQIKPTDYVVTLEILGNNITSEQLSKHLLEVEQTNPDITFVIGGSFGLDSEVIKRSNYALSFSKMTFPHQMAYLMLVEQIYRAYAIASNKPYHK